MKKVATGLVAGVVLGAATLIGTGSSAFATTDVLAKPTGSVAAAGQFVKSVGAAAPVSSNRIGTNPPGNCLFFELGQVKQDDDGSFYECEFTGFFGTVWVIIAAF